MAEEIEIEGNSSINTISNEPHEMRVTAHAKMRSFVAFALKFLQENPQRPLVLHTFPVPHERQVAAKVINVESQPAPEPNTDTLVDEESPKKKRKLATPTATTIKLVSVVEIIRREYGKWALERRGADGRLVADSLRMGLHQYNELSTLEALGLVDPQDVEQDDAENLRQALAGGDFLRQKFTAHLKVTLSVSARPELEERGATYQPPLPIVKSKSSRARGRKRMRKEAKMADVPGEMQVPK
ncbi:hypothetical protein BU17DRAFT_55047 [Hysterangium stoloniferum]|nr:hypothetical protein BU17DRAFT_55047 [Hysterangium stoloniferum]